MTKELKEIKALVQAMRDAKVSQFKVDGIEVVFSPMAFITPHIDPDMDPLTAKEQAQREAEEILYHSVV